MNPIQVLNLKLQTKLNQKLRTLSTLQMTLILPITVSVGWPKVPCASTTIVRPRIPPILTVLSSLWITWNKETTGALAVVCTSTLKSNTEQRNTKNSQIGELRVLLTLEMRTLLSSLLPFIYLRVFATSV